MKDLQYLMVKLAEEASEIAQEAMKVSQFGLESNKQGEQATNRDRLNNELNDLMTIVYLLNRDHNLGFKEDPSKQKAKILKMAKYKLVSKDLGYVE